MRQVRHLTQSDLVETVHALGRSAKELGLLARSGSAHQPLTRVPEHLIAVRDFVHRKVTLEHAARRAKRLDACLDVAPRLHRDDLRRWWFRVLSKPERGVPHPQSAYLHRNVLVRCEPPERGRPTGKYFFVTPLVSANLHRHAAVIQDNP